jgi:hypothetical protein
MHSVPAGGIVPITLHFRSKASLSSHRSCYARNSDPSNQRSRMRNVSDCTSKALDASGINRSLDYPTCLLLT